MNTTNDNSQSTPNEPVFNLDFPAADFPQDYFHHDQPIHWLVPQQSFWERLEEFLNWPEDDPRWEKLAELRNEPGETRPLDHYIQDFDKLGLTLSAATSILVLTQDN